MLNKLRGFSNTKLAGVLIAIIIVPFVFWGMGSVFSGGNLNNVAKINNQTISTEDFVNHINQSRINTDIIKKNIDKNIIEEILSELISNNLLNMEIDYHEIKLSEKALVKKIKNNESFLDDKKKFSRLKYEKFLLENNLTAPGFESRLKNQELKINLFDYISGGIKSPYFLKNKIYINETKQVEIDYIDLNQIYNNEISTLQIDDFINDNLEKLKVDHIDFSYTKITPKDLVEIDEFNNVFFKKIDEIENSILNGNKIDEIAKNYNLNLISLNNYKINEKSEEILKDIYAERNNDKTQIIDKNDFFLLFEIKKIDKILPNKTDLKFINNIKKSLISMRKNNLHQELFKKIQDKKFNNNEFIKIAQDKENIKNITINGIKDNFKFASDSINLIYALPKKSFVLISDKDNKIYLAKIKNIYTYKLSKDDQKIKDYYFKSNSIIINDIYSSYDLSLNTKYKVKIFQSTLDRVKNYFR
tara:strand:- start:1442 stop:2863 length:1422 start_codon:yes stop_codon:yes gene_type:complete